MTGRARCGASPAGASTSPTGASLGKTNVLEPSATKSRARVRGHEHDPGHDARSSCQTGVETGWGLGWGVGMVRMLVLWVAPQSIFKTVEKRIRGSTIPQDTTGDIPLDVFVHTGPAAGIDRRRRPERGSVLRLLRDRHPPHVEEPSAGRP